jgi:hypothetical protein
MLYVCESLLINISMPKKFFIEYDKYIMTSEPILKAYSTTHSHQSVNLCVHPVVAGQQFGKHIPAAKDTSNIMTISPCGIAYVIRLTINTV